MKRAHPEPWLNTLNSGAVVLGEPHPSRAELARLQPVEQRHPLTPEFTSGAVATSSTYF